MRTFIEKKQSSRNQMIRKIYRASANITEYHIISLSIFLRINENKAIIKMSNV